MQQRSSSHLLTATALLLLTAGAGCDGAPVRRDASAPIGQRASEISVRFDLPTGGTPPSVAILAFSANVIGGTAVDVLGVVDPLVASGAESGCRLRNVTDPTRALGAQGVRVELDALPDVAVGLPSLPPLEPAPRVYPEVGSVVGGVVNESAPIDLPQMPESLSLIGLRSAPEGPSDLGTLEIPKAPQLLDGVGEALAAGAVIDPERDLALRVEAPQLAKTVVELRPLYTTLALACPVDTQSGAVVIPAAQLAALARASGPVPISIEAVWRAERGVPVAGRPTRLSVEVHASTVVSLKK